MLAKLALRNVKRQIKNYLIYFVTVTLSVALLFAVNNLSYSDQIRQQAEQSTDINFMFNLVTVLSCFVTALVLSYVTGFMLKLRKKEFGMYLTLGLTRQNIRILFTCETWIMSLLALLTGIGAGLIIYQFFMALFSNFMEVPFTISAYSAKGLLLTVVISIVLFGISNLMSLRYLKRVTITELLREETVEKSEKRPVLWCVLSVVTVFCLVGSLVITYQSMMAVFHNQDGAELMLWLAVDLLMIFLSHVTLSRAIAGILLKNRQLKNRGTNVFILRGLSGKMTMNSLLIGALATLLVFAVTMSNISFGEKIYADCTVEKECPYDALAMFVASEKQERYMEEGRKCIERYSPIVSEIDYQLYSAGKTTLCSNIMGYREMEWTDKFMPLSRFNALLSGCGYETITLEDEYLVVTNVQGICDVDFSNKAIELNGKIYSWARSSTSYPEFVAQMLYFVVPDEALENMPVSDRCVAYTLKNKLPDVSKMVEELTNIDKTEYATEEYCVFRVREYFRMYYNAMAGTLIIGTLYVATVFVCLALAVLSLKILCTLEDERRRFAILYRLGTDEKTQKITLLKQISAFFLMPFAFPIIMTIPLGITLGKVYEFWGFAGLSGQKAMETAGIITLVIVGVYTLYFFITFRIACNYVVCHGSEPS